MRFLTCAGRLGGGFAGLALTGAASGTVLTFDLGNSSQAPDGISMENFQGYGDRVGGSPQIPQFSYGGAGGPTPNVVVRYGPGLHLAWSTPRVTGIGQQFGDLENVVFRDKYTQNPPFTQFIILTLFADPGYDILLHSFDVATILGENLPLGSVMVVRNPNQLIYQDVMPMIPGLGTPTHKHYEFTPALTGSALEIRLDVSLLPTKLDRFGIDNITFGQKLINDIPSPAVAGSMMACAGILAMRRRRA